MMHYAVVGASSGTGLHIVNALSGENCKVRAISRHPPAASTYVTPAVADVTDHVELSKALDGDLDIVFYTVDIHGMFNSRQMVRDVMVNGLANVIEVAKQKATPPKIILLSVIGPDKPSWVWGVLGSMKRGMKQNILDREAALIASGLRYVICRAPKLADGAGHKVQISATKAQHKLDMKMGIDRIDLARTLVRAAQFAPEKSIWDVFAQDGGPMPSWLQQASTE
jgi:uncharacterized protein YbjT (DUF2867 family)